MKKTVYCCGPMRNIPEFNFPAFDKARDRMKALGFDVISPADLDRAAGVDMDLEYKAGDPIMAEFVMRDIEAICKSDMLVLLEGWEQSIGANAEIAVAKWLGKPIKLFKDYADLI